MPIAEPSTARSARRRAPRARSRSAAALAAALGAGWWATQAWAAPPEMSQPSAADFAHAPESCGEQIFGGIDRSTNLLGSMCGLRTVLGREGISLGLDETSEVLGNLSGGTQRGFDYDGLTTLDLQMDTQRAFGHYGGTFNLSVLQIHGSSLSADNLQTLQTASGIEAARATRLWELWYQQKFGQDGADDIRIGQQSLDQEFMVSQNALVFVNTMFGWPMLPSADMPGGGPAYPLSAPGVRLRMRPDDAVTVLAGLFNASPLNNAGQNSSGTNFPVNGGALAIAEVQYAYPNMGTLLYPDRPEPLARVYKFGLWYDTANFPDQSLDTSGQSLADPQGTGVAMQHRGDWAWYAVADQMVWQDPREADRTLNAFVRVMGTPLQDRNLVNFSMNAGITMHEPFRGRDDDTFGLGMGYAHVSSSVADLDRATGAYTGSFVPVRGGETFVEATYQYQVTPWLQMQPDLQYVFHPGAGVADPADPGTRIANELVIGLRANIAF